MIRIITCLRKAADCSTEDFARKFESPENREMVQRVADLAQADRFQMNRTLVVKANTALQALRGGEEAFDAVVEYFFENAQTLQQKLATIQDTQVFKDVQAFQAGWVDPTRSVTFITTVQR